MESASPEPTAIVRSPLRTICTGTACSGSVISMTSALQGPTRSVWPSRPALATTLWPLNTLWFAPRLMTSLWRSVLDSTLITSPASHFSVSGGSACFRPRNWAFSRSSAALRIVASSSLRSSVRSARFSICSLSRASKMLLVQRQAADGELTASCSG